MPNHSTSNHLAVDQPTRDADRNQPLADQADPTTDEMLLRSLDDGITLLDVEGGRGVPLLQSLVLDHLLLNDGPALWVDANGHATTTTLAKIAPSRRLLDRIHVARGFTAYQHYSAVCDLSTAVTRSIQESTTNCNRRERHPAAGTERSHTPSLIVVPAIDVQYRTDDTLSQTDAATLHARTLARLATAADEYDIPVLVTSNEQNEQNEQNEFTESIERAADHNLECRQTRMGPRIVGDDFETLVYPVDDGTYYQTTFAYWRQLLAARATQVGVEPTRPAPSTPTPEGVGTGVTTDGETVVATANPSLDAWTATGGGGR